MEYHDTLDVAKHAMTHAYSPYSRFRVGSALKVGEDHFMGANIENASYGLTMCAERVAIYQAVMAGMDLEAATEIGLVSDSDSVITPCGACRQVMAELLPPEVEVIMSSARERVSMRVKDLLPATFGAEALGGK